MTFAMNLIGNKLSFPYSELFKKVSKNNYNKVDTFLTLYFKINKPKINRPKVLLL